MKNLDIRKLNNYVLKGKLRKQVHPTLPLIIWNYTRELQYTGDWCDITLMARGLVTDYEGNMINNPIPKFFNYSETRGKYGVNWKEPFKFYTKYDGSLIMVFWYNDELIVASKGSFESDHANAALKILDNIDKNVFKKGFTYSFEWIGPENRIVNLYEASELILLSIRDMDGKEYPLELKGFKPALIHDISIIKYEDLKKLVELNLPNEEGYVLLWENGDRVKVKFEEYVRLHTLLSNVSTTSIWENLKNGINFNEILSNIPDEIDNKIKLFIRDLKYKYYSHSEMVGKIFDKKIYGKYNDKDPITNKAEFAKWVLTQEKWMQPILFKMFDKKPYDDIIWGLIKPKYEKL